MSDQQVTSAGEYDLELPQDELPLPGDSGSAHTSPESPPPDETPLEGGGDEGSPAAGGDTAADEGT